MPLGLVIAAVVATACGGPSASSVPSSGSSVVPGSSDGATVPPIALPSLQPDPSFDAAALVVEVLEAPSDEARMDAVVDVLAALHIGVYTPEGEPIVTGAERSAADFVVYDFQAEALALAVRDGDEVFLEDVVVELSETSVRTGGPPIGTDVVAAALAKATAAAVADPADPAGYPLLLAREMGLRGPRGFDLASPEDGPIVLDALSAFLVEADLALPAVAAAGAPSLAARFRTPNDGEISLAAFTAADPCDRFGRDLGRDWYVSRGWRQIPGLSGANAAYSQALQRRLFGGTVQLTMAYDDRWHHLHKGESAFHGYWLGVKLRVAVPADIKCGPAIGRLGRGGRVAGGAVEGAEVTWETTKLSRHADFDCNQGCRYTASDGIAILAAVPLTEPGPGGIGPEFVEPVPVAAQINLADALGPELFAMLQQPPDSRVLATKRVTSMVAWHNAYEVRVEIDSSVYATAWGVKMDRNGKLVPDLFHHVTTATATGFVIAKENLHRSGEHPDLKVDAYPLITTAGGGATPGKCNTATVKGAGSVGFQVVDAVIWPPEKLLIYLDVGPAQEYPDIGWLVLCDGRGNVVLDDKPRFSAWEHYLLLGYPQGMLFDGTGPDRWHLANNLDAVWEQGGTLATWNNLLGCGGWCDPAKSYFNKKIVLEVLPFR